MAGAIDVLREHLSRSQFELLLRLTSGGRRLPIGDEAERRIEAMLLEGGDEAVELLLEIERLFGSDESRAVAEAAPRERLVFDFDVGSRAMEHFLGSLQRNGFEAVVVEGDAAYVYVYVTAVSDEDFYRQRAIISELRAMTKVLDGKHPKGRRLY